MKYLISFLILFTSLAHAADDFSSRAKAGDDAAKTKEGMKYQQAIGSFIGETMYACILSQPPDAAAPDKFTLVASVTKAGQLSDVAVKPEFKGSLCFSREFTRYRFPIPPQENNTPSGYPLTVTISTKR